MLETVLERHYRDRVQSVREIALHEAEQAALSWPDFADLVALCSELSVSGRDLLEKEYKRIFKESNLTVAWAWQAAGSPTGQHVIFSLDGAIQAVAQAKQSVLERWPVGTNEEAAETKAYIARGETVDADEAFAEIAGLDVEAWRKQVEEYKRRNARPGIDQVAALTEGVLKTMLVLKLKAMFAVVLALGTFSAGAGWLYYQAGAAQPAGADAEGKPGNAKPMKEEDLRREVARLNKELAAALKRTAAVEAELRRLAQQFAVRAEAEENRLAAKDGDREVRYQDKPTSFWLKKFKDRDPTFRAEAVVALGEIGVVEKKVLPTVFEALRDRNDEVASAASHAFAAVGKEAVPYLIRALKEERPSVRRFAVSALVQIGPDAKDAVPALLLLLKKRDPAVPEAVLDPRVARRESWDGLFGRAVTRLSVIDPEIGQKLKEALKAK